MAISVPVGLIGGYSQMGLFFCHQVCVWYLLVSYVLIYLACPSNSKRVPHVDALALDLSGLARSLCQASSS